MKSLFLGFIFIFCFQAQANDVRRPWFPKRDLEQCDRRCQDVYPESNYGIRERFKNKDKCICFHDEKFRGVVDRKNDEWGIPDAEGIVCGKNGKEYTSSAEAALDGTVALHAGNCGECSNEEDIRIYLETRHYLTKTVSGCAVRMVFFGMNVGEHCLNKKVGFTPSCTKCWVDNMSCTFNHCSKICMKSRRHNEGSNASSGELNECLACDEKYCGSMFIKCAGANRRRSGIVSDIGRPDAQVWNGN